MAHALVTMKFADEDEAKAFIANFDKGGDRRFVLPGDTHVWAEMIAASIPRWHELLGTAEGG